MCIRDSVTEICRPIAYFFQQAAEGRLRLNRPRLCDVACERTSVLIQAQQYISSFVSNSPEPAL
eukprot:3129349-Pyramimonas_sp.AAC.1